MEGYIVSLIIFTAVFAMFSLGLNLQWGFTGLLNFGQVAFMLVSAYLVVMLTSDGYLQSIPTQLLEEFEWMANTPPIAHTLQFLSSHLPSQVPIMVAVIIGAIASALVGILMGFATLKLRTDYLAIVTIGISEILRSVALNEQWLTRGSFGIQRFPLPLADLNPNYGMRLGMIVSFTAVVGWGTWLLWQWIHKTTKSVPKSLLIRNGGLLLGYGAAIGLCVWGTGAIAHAINNLSALPQWVAGFVSVLGLSGITWASITIGKKYLGQLSNLSASMAVVSTLVITGLGLWVYGFAVSALYHYDRNPTKTGLMWICVLTIAAMVWGLERLVQSPWGRVLKSIREDEDVALTLGKNVFWYKLQALMLGGAITGLSGALYVWQLTAVYPDQFKPIATFNGWTIVVLGGAGNNIGTLLGATIFWTYQTASRFFLDDLFPFTDAQLGALRVMLIGLLLMVLMMVRPQGLLGKSDELTLNR
ncbi:MAG: branched-chain amino acid ABC transporter permease [Cyanobacteria bacterium P01_F01_bin.150]